MNDIHVVGSQFEDSVHIISNGKYYQRDSYGGICNLGIQASYWPTDHNECTEVINKYGREGLVTVWGKESRTKSIQEEIQKKNGVNFIHFAYLNTISGNLNVADFPSSFRSCDLSTSWRPGITKEQVLRNIKDCDITFMSTEFLDIRGSFEFFEAANTVILHGEGQITEYLDKKTLPTTFYFKPEKFVYTLGAGDKFAANWIEGFLSMKYKSKQLLEYAHENTLKWLKEINEKI